MGKSRQHAPIKKPNFHNTLFLWRPCTKASQPIHHRWEHPHVVMKKTPTHNHRFSQGNHMWGIPIDSHRRHILSTTHMSSREEIGPHAQ